MKEPVQKVQQPAAESSQSHAGLSMSPPEFGLTAGPVQAKMAAGANVVQRKPKRTPEQEQLRQDFDSYREIKESTLKDPTAKADFVLRAGAFVLWAEDHWGDKAYVQRLQSQFGDYQTTLDGKFAELKGAALQDAETALATANGAVANAQIAIQQASGNIAVAEKAAAEADAEATKAETAATNAEANALLPESAAPEKEAAQKARAAAVAARAAADAAKQAVEAAKDSQAAAENQLHFAAAQAERAEDMLKTTQGLKTIQAAARQQKANARLKKGTDTTASVVESNLAAGNAARTTAENSSATAKTAAETASQEEAKSKPIPGLNAKLQDLGNATAKKDRKAKAKELITFARAEIAKYPALVSAYKDQATPDPEAKVKVIGQLAATAAKVEWLIGTIYLEGSGESDKWKNHGKSKALTADEEKFLGNYYEQKVGAKSGPVWCTAFLGAIYMTAAGIKDTKGKSPKGGQLWSGYKVGKHGKDANFDFSEDAGGKHVGTSEAKKDNSFHDLHKEIVANKDDQAKREEIVQKFFKDHFTPQAGDPMIVKRSDPKKGKKNPTNDFANYLSHTTMVERVEGTKIYTIEGNAGNRVQGRVYDLADPVDSGKVVFIARFSLNNFGTKPDPKKAAATAADTTVAAAPQLGEADLLAPMSKLAASLQGFAQTKGYIKTLAADELNVVNNLKQAAGAAGPGE